MGLDASNVPRHTLRVIAQVEYKLECAGIGMDAELLALIREKRADALGELE
jgi:hypothetical protein